MDVGRDGGCLFSGLARVIPLMTFSLCIFIYTLSSHFFRKNLNHNLQLLFNVEVLFNGYSNAKLECSFEVLIF